MSFARTRPLIALIAILAISSAGMKSAIAEGEDGPFRLRDVFDATPEEAAKVVESRIAEAAERLLMKMPSSSKFAELM